MSLIVVSDTSPIRALGHLGLITLLPQLFARICVPPAVVRELAIGVPGSPQIEVSKCSFLEVINPTDIAMVARLLLGLDAGESEALALALELKPDFVLIDEATGRRTAKRLGLKPLGALGLLAQARRRGLIGPVAPLIDRLVRELEFRVTPELVRAVLTDLGE